MTQAIIIDLFTGQHYDDNIESELLQVIEIGDEEDEVTAIHNLVDTEPFPVPPVAHSVPVMSEQHLSIKRLLSPQQEASSLFWRVPSNLLSLFPWIMMPQCVTKITSSRDLGSDDPWKTTPSENRSIKVFLRSHNSVPAKYGGRNDVEVIRTENASLEWIQTYTCQGKNCGCSFEMKFARLHFDNTFVIVAYQKCIRQLIDGHEVYCPIAHNNHRKFPFFDSKTKGEKKKKELREVDERSSHRYRCEQAPSMEQLSDVVSYRVKNKSWKLFLEDMKSRNVMFHDCQLTENGKNKLIKCLTRFCGNHPSLFGSIKEYEAMSVSEVSSALDLLVDKPESASSFAVMLRDGKDPDFLSSHMWELLSNKLFVHSHNFGLLNTGRFHITFRLV